MNSLIRNVLGIIMIPFWLIVFCIAVLICDPDELKEWA